MTSPSPPAESTPIRLVDWANTARRMRRSALVLVGAAVLAWAITGLGDGWTVVSLANWLGLAVLAMFVVEVVVVGGSAARGLVRAGDRGERLSGGDVGLLPPTRSRTAGHTDEVVGTVGPDDADERAGSEDEGAGP